MSAPIDTMTEEQKNESTSVAVHDEPSISTQQTLSKSQMKKLRKKEKWEQVKAEKRKAEKERHKARKKACRERGVELPPTRKQLRHNKMSKSKCRVRVVIDCDFDDYMADKDIKMLVKQIQYSYSANRRSQNPIQFYCCGISGKTQDRLESIGDYRGWDINFHTESFMEQFEKSSIVYLSSESPNVLQSLEDEKVYVIGGLVDHNHHKGLCHQLAEEKGLAHAQLPISQYIDMKTRKVLTINHVFEILLHYTETGDWEKSFYTVLPPRKGAVIKHRPPCDKAASTAESGNLTGGLETGVSEKTDSTSELEDSDQGKEDTDQGNDEEDKPDPATPPTETVHRRNVEKSVVKCPIVSSDSASQTNGQSAEQSGQGNSVSSLCDSADHLTSECNKTTPELNTEIMDHNTEKAQLAS